MICFSNCMFAIIFISATLFMNFSIDKQNIFKNYIKILDKEQLIKYNKIIEERKRISLNGYLLGLIFSIVFILVNYNLNKLNYYLIICLTGSIMFIVHYFYYILSPKTDWMVLHLNKDQMKEWLRVYRTMQLSYHISLVVGIISAMILSSAFKC